MAKKFYMAKYPVASKDILNNKADRADEVTAVVEALALEIKRVLDKCRDDYDKTLETMDETSTRLDYTLDAYIPILLNLSRALGNLRS